MDKGFDGSVTMLLNVTQVARQLGVSTRTVWRLVSGRQLAQPVVISRCKRWHRNDVDAFVNSLKN
ncbi:MAG TPA: helix-turn-helix domain-containing protein [Tepidisphaeraceae bacterium]|jgi:predicted DNA-binding transcriptional regulator AlpA